MEAARMPALGFGGNVQNSHKIVILSACDFLVSHQLR
jgi:hypothetical protein